jgi:3-dehydroquinate synthase/2-deoxy-scyllo-inosose synthase
LITAEPHLILHEVVLGASVVRYVSGLGCADLLAAVLLDEFRDVSSILLLVDTGARCHADDLLPHLKGGPRIVSTHVDTHESAKTLTAVHGLLDRAIAAGIDRASIVVAMGGGVLGNIAGMVAALLYRGLPLVHLPTTPVAAFDAVLSAKQAVNLGHGKNLCGTYLTPSLIACDLGWLRTVPTSQLLTGLAEMVKNVLAVLPDDADRLLDALAEPDSASALATLLDIGVRAKVPFLVGDPQEKGEALVFEYGHTVGHALEFASGGTLSHGEAVAWGMLAAAEVSARMVSLPEAARAQHHRLVSALALDRTKLAAVDSEAVKRLLDNDNKRGYLPTGPDLVPRVFLRGLGDPVTYDGRPLAGVPRALVNEAVDSLFSGMV